MTNNFNQIDKVINNYLKTIGLNDNARTVLVNSVIDDINQDKRNELMVDLGNIKRNTNTLLQLQYTNNINQLTRFTLDVLLLADNDGNRTLLNIAQRHDPVMTGDIYHQFMGDLVYTGVLSDTQAKQHIKALKEKYPKTIDLHELKAFLPLIFHNQYWTDGLEYCVAHLDKVYTFDNPSAKPKFDADRVPNSNWLIKRVTCFYQRYLYKEGIVDKFNNLTVLGHKLINLDQSQLDKFHQISHTKMNFEGRIDLDQLVLKLAHGLKYMHQLSKHNSFKYVYGLGMALILNQNYWKFRDYKHQHYSVCISPFVYLACVLTMVNNLLDVNYLDGAFNNNPDVEIVNLVEHLRAFSLDAKDFYQDRVHNVKHNDKLINFNKHQNKSK